MTRKTYGKRSYPNGIDPSKVDETHNAKGEYSPYSEHQRKQAAARVRSLEDEGFSHEEAMDIAFDEVGKPEHSPLGENPDNLKDFDDAREGRL